MTGRVHVDARTGRMTRSRSAPFEVTRLQLRRALEARGLWAAFAAALEAAPEAAEAWAIATAVRSDDPAVAQIAAALGVDAVTVRDIFDAARRG